MKIAAFGSTYAGGYTFPTYKAFDAFPAERPANIQRVGGSSGAYDFNGETANPIAPLLVRKSFEITASTYAGVETALNTARASLLAANENKLWALMRDGSKRWAYAKVVSFDAPETPATRMTIPVSVEFVLREGIWYSETAHTDTTLDETNSVGAHSFTNSGNIATPVKITVAVSGTPMSAFSATASGNGWSYAGTIAAGDSLVVDSAAYSVTNGGAEAFTGLTPVNYANFFLRFEPGSNSITIAKSQIGGAHDVTIEWYDAWVM